MRYTFDFSKATRLALALLYASIVTTCCGCGGGGGGGGGGGDTPTPAGDTTPPAISSTTVSPASVSPFGGAVTISAQVTDNVGVAGVVATVGKPDGTSATVTLSGSGTFTGAFTAPSNGTTVEQTYIVRVGASDSSGNTALGASVPFVVQAPDPPPPPPDF